MIRFSKKITDSKRGETIAETIIALTILAMGITFSSALMSGSLKNVNVSKTRVMAVNIAREGIEAMRNIRDTNWLKFSGKRRMCWNHMPQATLPDDCDGLSLINPGSYIIYKDTTQRWRLKAVSTDPFDNTKLYFVDIDKNTDSDKDGNLENDKDMYNHKTVTTGDDALGIATAQATQYRRIIKIEYLDNDGAPVTEMSGRDDVNRMQITSTVTWQDGGNVGQYTVELKTHLTDYLGRENLQN
jgi:hypothetical protein